VRAVVLCFAVFVFVFPGEGNESPSADGANNCETATNAVKKTTTTTPTTTNNNDHHRNNDDDDDDDATNSCDRARARA
jgi:hypothetical protein